MVSLPYEKDFNEKQIPTKAKPIQMNPELLEYCKKEINDLLDKNLIRASYSPWSCAAFYVQKASDNVLSDNVLCKKELSKKLFSLELCS